MSIVRDPKTFLKFFYVILWMLNAFTKFTLCEVIYYIYISNSDYKPATEKLLKAGKLL